MPPPPPTPSLPKWKNLTMNRCVIFSAGTRQDWDKVYSIPTSNKKTCLCWVRPRGKPSIPLQELYYGSTVISKIAFSNKVKNGTLYLVNGNDQSLLTFLHKGFWFGWFVRVDTNTPWCVMFKELYRILWFLNSVGVFASNSIALAQNRRTDD